MDEVAGAFDDDAVMVGEDLLPSPQLCVPGGDVGIAPDDESPNPG
jgi:hypothetical protein